MCRERPVTLCALSGLGKTSRSAFQCLQKFQQHNKALKRKEWTEEEDRMLTQLVQEMRVGSHIPYRRSERPGWPGSGHPESSHLWEQSGTLRRREAGRGLCRPRRPQGPQ